MPDETGVRWCQTVSTGVVWFSLIVTVLSAEGRELDHCQMRTYETEKSELLCWKKSGLAPCRGAMQDVAVVQVLLAGMAFAVPALFSLPLGACRRPFGFRRTALCWSASVVD